MARAQIKMSYHLELNTAEFTLICRLLRGMPFRDPQEAADGKQLADDLARQRIIDVEQHHAEIQKLKKNLEG